QSTAPDSVNGVDRIMKAPRIGPAVGGDGAAAAPSRGVARSADAGSAAADASAARQSRRVIDVMAPFQRLGSAKLRMRSPPRRPRSPPPEATATNSSPFTM